MLYRRKIRKVYYHVVEGSHYLFADERHKKKLLDILSEIEKEEEWLIYAFCLTDDCAYFIIEAPGAGAVRRGIQRLANRFLSQYRAELPRSGNQGIFLSSTTLDELDSLSEIAICCRQIHRIPLEKGYVSCLDDYWWSSYITYTGDYEWELVDCRAFLLYFSANPEAARYKLQNFHR